MSELWFRRELTSASRLTALAYQNAAGPLGDLSSTYDPAGNRIGIGGTSARTLLGDTEAAYAEACTRKRAGEPVYIVGHSLGARAALAVARQLVSRCGFAPDHVFTLDPFEAPDVKAPPGVPVTNFYQRRSWWFQGPEVGGARDNIFVPGAFHQTITGVESVRNTIEQTTIESRGLTDSLGGRY